MYLYFIKLKELLNDASSLDLSAEFLPLNHSKKPPLLIYGKALGEAILKSSDFIPMNLIDYFKVINNKPNTTFPSIDLYFNESPLFLNNQGQSDARKALSLLYKNMEDKLLEWLPSFTKNYFADIEMRGVDNPIRIAEQYTLGIFKKMILTELDCKEDMPMEFPGTIANMYKSAKDLGSYDRKLSLLFKFIEDKLLLAKRPPEDAWKIVSVVIMGTEAISNTLGYSMMMNERHENKWDAQTLAEEVTPISFTGRLSIKDTQINNMAIQEGQEVHVSFHLINKIKSLQDKPPEKSNALAFGIGKHMCPGRKISLIIIQTFLDEWECFKGIKINSSHISYSRDLVFRLKENI